MLVILAERWQWTINKFVWKLIRVQTKRERKKEREREGEMKKCREYGEGSRQETSSE